MFVDSLTHALVASMVFYGLGLMQLLPFTVIGVVIIDADILFSLLSRGNPSLYLFIHGGIAHSIAGATVMSVISYVGIWVAVFVGLICPTLVYGSGAAGFAAILAGAFLHLAMDLPATPGIPLFAPASDRKYSFFLLPGPSLFLMGVSFFLIIWMILGALSFAQGMVIFAVFFGLFLLIRIVAYLISRPELRKMTCALPQMSPLQWIAISETPDSWCVQNYRIGSGFAEPEFYPKFRDISPKEILPYLSLPEVKRLKYHSFIVIAAKEGNEIVFSDPLRVTGKIFYPPHFKQVRIAIMS
ncbi:MAG: metal-dependent hydrolase [Methanoregula sp.]